MIDCFEAQEVIARRRGDSVVVTVGTCVKEWPRISSSDLDVPCGGAMGKGSSFALGLALALPARKVILLDADGGLLMNLGSLVTIANMAPPNLVHFVFNSGTYRLSGGQPIPGAGKTSFKTLAKGAGYPQAREFDAIDDLDRSLPGVMARAGPTLVSLKCAPLAKSPPYPFIHAPETIIRFGKFRKAIGVS
ncbi:MAG: thiamine pyrophosphate-binding protein [Chloroflexi bacterium]|nr:thiamine pyrophosphate-binding protein [Chloroflexota bacterium]